MWRTAPSGPRCGHLRQQRPALREQLRAQRVPRLQARQRCSAQHPHEPFLARASLSRNPKPLGHRRGLLEHAPDQAPIGREGGAYVLAETVEPRATTPRRWGYTPFRKTALCFRVLDLVARPSAARPAGGTNMSASQLFTQGCSERCARGGRHPRPAGPGSEDPNLRPNRESSAN